MSRWIRTDEMLPERMKNVILCRADGKVEQGYRDVMDWWKVYGTRTKKITHWMPLPAPPCEDETHGKCAECVHERLCRLYWKDSFAGEPFATDCFERKIAYED